MLIVIFLCYTSGSRQKGSDYVETAGRAEKEKTSKRREEVLKIVKWSITGIGSAVVELGIFALLRFLFEHAFVSFNERPVYNSFLNFLGIKYLGYLIAYFTSACIGYALAFIINRIYSFKADGNLAVSATVNVVFTFINILFVTWLGTVLSNLSVERSWGFWGDMLIKVSVMTVPVIWAYPINRFVIHRKKKK
ncbi:MAG TPA: hypothetical protein P5127_03255 [Oscillospiraceae bacterium]|nr:hypothetical protein [Oscillospiraceae bacterium]